MGRADSLSRRVDWAEGVEKDNENQIMLKEEWLEVRAMEWLIEGPEEEIVKRIKEARNKDEEVIKMVEEMKKAGVKTLKEEEWQIEEGLVLKEGRVYVPKDEKLRVEIIRLHHDTPIVGHGGQWKTVELVTRNYWWPEVTKEVKRYVVRKIVSENAVELELLVSLRIHPVVNVRRIVKYREQVEGQKKIPPPPVEVAGEKEYEVEEILHRQEKRGKTKYLVKWRGYTAEENT